MKEQNEKIEKKTSWYAESVDFAFEKTKSSKDGLTTEEAEKRLKENGANVLPQKKAKSVFLMFLEEIINPIVLILLVAMTFSFVVGELLDGFVILGIVMIDAVIGTVQSKRAERIASSLSNMIKVKSRVLRDGTKTEIESCDLVVGDIVYLESGDKISADMRIV